MRWHEAIGELDELGLDYDTTLGWTSRPGPRAGLSFPFLPWSLRHERALRIVEVPLLLMDATLGEERYLGLSPAAAEAWTDRVLDDLERVGGAGAILWHNDRFDAVYGRGWGRLYEHVLDGIAARGGIGMATGRSGRVLAGSMRLLIASFYFPPAGGGGVQRVLAFCRDLPEHGIEVHVLAPDDPRWSARDPGLAGRIPAGCVVHRARYRGPSFEQTPAARMAAARGPRRLTTPRIAARAPAAAARPGGRVAARRGARGASGRARARDRRGADDLAARLGAPDRRARRAPGGHPLGGGRAGLAARAPAPGLRAPNRSVSSARPRSASCGGRSLRAGAITAVTPFIRDEAAALAPRLVPVEVIANGCDFSAFEGLVHTPSPRLRIVHTGSFFGQRSPRPFCEALRALLDARPDLQGRIEARFLGELRPDDRAWAGRLGLGDALRLDGFVPHSEALAAMKGADVLLLLVPRAGGRGLSVLSGKVYEYLAAERPLLALVPPEGAAAALVRDTSAGVVADPDDVPAITAALGRLADDWDAGRLEAPVLSPEWRERLDRRTRAAELAGVLQRLLALRAPAR